MQIWMFQLIMPVECNAIFKRLNMEQDNTFCMKRYELLLCCFKVNNFLFPAIGIINNMRVFISKGGATYAFCFQQTKHNINLK